MTMPMVPRDRRIDRFSIPALVFAVCAGCGGPGKATTTGNDAVASQPAAGQASAPHPQVILPGGRPIDVEIATLEETRAQGLMFRESVPRGRGMLFLFPEPGIHPFWMKNTVVSLDIIWIDEEGFIVHIARGAEPCGEEPCPSFDPGAEALYVLELAGGEAAYWGLEVGNRVEMRNLEDVIVR